VTPYKFVVFDFDGTLVDSVDAIAKGIQKANQTIGIKPVSYETAKSVIGLGFKDIIPIVASDLDPARYEEYKNIYVGYFLQSDPYLKLFPKVLDLMDRLHEAGIKTAIATGKSRKGLSRIVNRMGIEAYFDDSVTSDEAKPKPDPLMLHMLMERGGFKPSDMVMVGDTEHDIRLAKAAGVDAIAVSWGAAPRLRLEEYQPKHIADTMDELASMLGVRV